MSFKSIMVIFNLLFLFLCLVVFQLGFARLQGRRQYELATLDEKLRESYVPIAIPETSGLLRGILYSKTKPSIVIDDKRKIVYEGNTIEGVTIVKIHKDKVEFAKNNQRWTQKVGEAPKAHWE